MADLPEDLKQLLDKLEVDASNPDTFIYDILSDLHLRVAKLEDDHPKKDNEPN